MKFQYTHLQPNSIRLFRFSQYATPMFIHGWLEHLPDYRNSRNQYCAITACRQDSDEQEQKSITVNGRSFMVPTDLWHALSSIAEHHNHGYGLWIQAVSINAGDPVEMNDQLARKSSILDFAKEVLLWIGEEDEQSETAFSILQQRDYGGMSSEGCEIADRHRIGLNENESDAVQSILNRERVRNALDQPNVLQRENASVICGQYKCKTTALVHYQRSLKSNIPTPDTPGSVL